MHPFFLLTPLGLLWFVAGNVPAARSVTVGAALLAVTLAIVPIRAVNLARSIGPDCRSCRLAVPYKGIADILETRGFGSGTLMVMDRDDGGNLRRLFPKARIVLLRRSFYAPRLRPQDLSTQLLSYGVLPMGRGFRPRRGAPFVRSAEWSPVRRRACRCRGSHSAARSNRASGTGR